MSQKKPTGAPTAQQARAVARAFKAASQPVGPRPKLVELYSVNKKKAAKTVRAAGIITAKGQLKPVFR